MRQQTKIRALRVAVALTAIALATPATAQSQGVRHSLERTVAAICAKADRDGDDYRPFVCDPRCECAAGQSPSLAEVDACAESPAGVFTAQATVTNTPVCTGSCERAACPIGNFDYSERCQLGDTCYGGTCEDQCANPCTGDPWPCLKLCSLSRLPCATDADCSRPCEFVTGNPPVALGQCLDAPCQTTADCAPGYSCNALLQTCVATTSCDDVTPCPSATTTRQVLRLDGVLPPDDPGAVACEAGQVSPVTTSINSNDALECLAQIEAAVGAPCTPAP